jgi:hypothetical protein
MRTQALFAALVSTVLMGATAQQSPPTVSGIVRERMPRGTGIPSVQVSANPPGNPRPTASDGTFILEFPQLRPGASILIKLEKTDDRNGEEYVVVNDVQLETFLPNDPTRVLTFIMCKKHEREEYARHFYKMGSLSSIKDAFERKLASLRAEREQLEQKLNATQELAVGQEHELLRQLHEKDETISQLQHKRSQAEAQAESISESLAAGTAGKKSERYREAMRLFLEGNVEDALKLLDDKAIGDEADLGQTNTQNAVDEWLLKAAVFTGKLRFDEAEATYRLAIAKVPFSFDLKYGYAQFNLALNHYDAAIDDFSRSAQLAEGSKNKVQAAKALNALGITYTQRHDYESAASTLKRSLSAYEALAPSDPATLNPFLARALINLGMAERHLDVVQQASAKEHFERAKTILSALPQPELPSNLYLSAALDLNLGNLYLSRNHMKDALIEYDASVASYQRLAESDARSIRPEQAQALNNLGEAERRIGEAAPTSALRKTSFSQAERHLQGAETLRQQLADESPQAYRPAYAETLVDLGAIYMTETQFDRAREKLEKAKAIRSELAQQDPKTYQNDFANTLTFLGKLYNMQYGSARDPQLLQQALLNLNEAVGIRRPLAKSNPRQFTLPLGDSLESAGTVYMDQKHWDEAKDVFDEALKAYEVLDPQTRAYPAFRILRKLGYLELGRGRTAEARTAFGQAQDYLASFSPDEKIIHRHEVLDVAGTLAALNASSKREKENPK